MLDEAEGVRFWVGDVGEFSQGQDEGVGMGMSGEVSAAMETVDEFFLGSQSCGIEEDFETDHIGFPDIGKAGSALNRFG